LVPRQHRLFTGLAFRQGRQLLLRIDLVKRGNGACTLARSIDGRTRFSFGAAILFLGSGGAQAQTGKLGFRGWR